MQRTESSTFDDSQTLQRQEEFAVGDAPSGSASQTGLASRQIGAMLKDPENVGEHTRLACFDGRPAGRSSPSKPHKITSTGKLIDDALEAVEGENPNGAERHRRPSNVARRVRAGVRLKLKNVLNKNYTQLQIDPADLAGLIDLTATIRFQHADLHAKDILGHFYDWSGVTKSLPKKNPKGKRGGAHQYFLGQLALAERKKGGQYSRPSPPLASSWKQSNSIRTVSIEFYTSAFGPIAVDVNHPFPYDPLCCC